MFVTVAGGPEAIGKVVSADSRTATVEYFHPFAPPSRCVFQLEQVRPASPLERNTVVYFEDEHDRWHVGQVVRSRNGGSGGYELNWAGKKRLLLPAEALHVPGIGRAVSPLRQLLNRCFTNPAFHDKRSAFLHHLMEMRQATLGMSALASSRIHLLPHQVEIVRQILADPIQRYLLADEVGLGKSIEAGVILRQYLLDHPNGQVLLIAPPSLLDQWRRELFTKFTLADLGIQRVKRVSPRELLQDRRLSQQRWGLLIVDEAHHVSAGAFSTDTKARDAYTRLAAIAQPSTRDRDRMVLVPRRVRATHPP